MQAISTVKKFQEVVIVTLSKSNPCNPMKEKMWTAAAAATPLATQRHGIASVLAGATVCAAWYNSTQLEEAKATEEFPSRASPAGNNPIEINLMDKIANKVYLNPVRVRSSLQKRDSDTPPASVTETIRDRPVGVPSRLRILAIDLPEMRNQAFAKGTCQLAFDRVFPDGVAPAKRVTRDRNGGVIEIEQKTWVKSVVKCMQNDLPDKIGVEMMEASFSDLNPKNLRKIRQLGGYHYDPGKYASDSKEKDQEASTLVAEGYEVSEEDEMEAPWNQYAWIEELKLRVHGMIPFGDSLDSSSRLHRYFYGNHFKPTVPSQNRWYLPSFLQPNPGGIDGADNMYAAKSNWASQKPHVVIANGAAAQKMPSGLRLLQKTCREAGVPLFVINDKRSWGGNTHQSLEHALKDVRYVVKQNIILSAMEHQSGFSRGRRVGRMERTVEQWSANAKKDRQRRQDALKKRQWQKLDAGSLEKRLMEYGVLRKEDRAKDGKTHRQYTPAFQKIARQCVKDIQEAEGDDVDAKGNEGQGVDSSDTMESQNAA